MKMSEKINTLGTALKDVLETIEKGEETDGPTGAVYTVKFGEAVLIKIRETLVETGIIDAPDPAPEQKDQTAPVPATVPEENKDKKEEEVPF